MQIFFAVVFLFLCYLHIHSRILPYWNISELAAYIRPIVIYMRKQVIPYVISLAHLHSCDFPAHAHSGLSPTAKSLSPRHVTPGTVAPLLAPAVSPGSYDPSSATASGSRRCSPTPLSRQDGGCASSACVPGWLGFPSCALWDCWKWDMVCQSRLCFALCRSKPLTYQGTTAPMWTTVGDWCY